MAIPYSLSPANSFEPKSIFNIRRVFHLLLREGMLSEKLFRSILTESVCVGGLERFTCGGKLSRRSSQWGGG